MADQGDAGEAGDLDLDIQILANLQLSPDDLDAADALDLDDVIDELISTRPYYAKAVVPGGMYKGNDEPVETFGVKATFVTSAKVSDDVVYAIVKEVFENFDKFVKLHPAYKGLTKEDMLKGLSAPIHPGAMKYYKEVGLK